MPDGRAGVELVRFVGGLGMRHLDLVLRFGGAPVKKRDSAAAIVRDLAAWDPDWDSCKVCRGNNPAHYRHSCCQKTCLGYRARAVARAKKRKEGK